jgi:hypothetical protein
VNTLKTKIQEMIKDDPQMVAVRWIDSFSPKEVWACPTEYMEPIEIYTVGWALKIDDDQLYLCGGLVPDDEDDVMSFTAIPLGCIQGICKLEAGETIWKKETN